MKKRKWSRNARNNKQKSLNLRQAEDFALKAQLAKARGAVISALKELPDGQSHK